jgi:hypothetical protein
VTAAGVGRPARRARQADPAPRRSTGYRLPGLRLARLYAASRRAATCLLVLAACAIALRAALHWLPRAGAYAEQIPLTIEAGAAAVIGVTTGSPFGDPERATGRWLPYLRLVAAVALGGAAFGALAAGSASQHLDGGTLGLLRDLAGFTGLAFLAGAVLGGALAWIGPIGYLAITLPTLAGHWTTPWLWPDRPPHDRGAAICAGLVFAAGLAVVTVRGARAWFR